MNLAILRGQGGAKQSESSPQHENTGPLPSYPWVTEAPGAWETVGNVMDIAIPGPLADELRFMRRKPEDFSVTKRTKCKFGCGPDAAYTLWHPQSEGAGTWCPIHGWLFFDSIKLRLAVAA